MTNIYIGNIIRFFLLILFQILILNNILFSGYINPYVYVLFILSLPFNTPKLLLLVFAFLVGITVDIFSHTYGLHAAACLAMAFMRPFIIKNIYSRQEYEPGIQPIIRDLGFNWVLTYTGILVLLHHLVLFYLEAFSFYNFWTTFLRMIFSAIFTTITIMISHYLFYKTKK